MLCMLAIGAPEGLERFDCSLPLPYVRSFLHLFAGHCEQKAMRDEGIIYVAGRPLLNRRWTRLPGCFDCFKRNICKLSHWYQPLYLQL